MRLLILLSIVGILALALGGSEEKRDEDIVEREVEVEERDTSNCGTDSAWEPTPSAYTAADTDSNLLSWWNNISSQPSHEPLPNALARIFGSHQYDFSCGIGDDFTCTVPGCQDFSANNDPPWTYLAIEAISQLNRLFNALYSGVAPGQADYIGLIGNISEDFFTWGDGQAHQSSSSTWEAWAASAASSFILRGVGNGVGNAVAGVVTITGTSVTPGLTETEGVAVLGQYVVSVGQQLRGWIQDWANTTLNGDQTSNNGTLFDYLKNGNALSLNIPSAMEAENFYKRVFLSKTITDSWVANKTFIYSALTDDPNDASGPDVTKYYSAETGRVYYMYTYHPTGRLAGNLDVPRGLDMLNDSRYGIDPKAITKSSAVAWEASSSSNSTSIAGVNSTVSFVRGNGTLNPFAPEGEWEGLWTLPICDIGNNTAWNAQYGHDSKHGRYGSLPCCCGPNCRDTKAFIESISMKGLQTLLVGCKIQMRNSNVTAENGTVDYGFKMKLNFRQKWDSWSTGQRAGVGIGMTLACLVGVLLIFWWISKD